MEEVKRIPYGVSNFVEVVEQNQYYVDKTMYLPLLEKQPSNLFFIRPRRFGKSIFLSMLRTYYDIAQKEKFEKRFSNLWIGSHPTQLQGTFQILFLDFSRVGGLDGTLTQNFDDYCCGGLDDFASIYESYYYPGFEEEMKAQCGTTNKLNFLDRKARNNGSKLYLIVDEYDNFTNVVLNEQGDRVYHALTHASGFYREIFKKFKGMFERIFMTGVSPVTLDDLTSGFNIGWNISIDHQFNMMLGFSETYGTNTDVVNKESGRSTRTGYYLRKLLRKECNPNSQYNTKKKHYTARIRYTEMFLIYAEAANEAWGPQNNHGHLFSAYDVIKAIRTRAGLGLDNGDAYLESIKDNKDKMRELIRNERRIELCFENFRFWDLRRWNVDLTKLNETALGVEISKNGSVMNYSPLTVEKRKYEEYMIYGPIPFAEVMKWSNLEQNVGWK